MTPREHYPWWFAYTFDNALRRVVQDPERILTPYLKPGMHAMDVGCGMGFLAIAMAKLVGPSGRVTAVDVSGPLLRVLGRRADSAGVAGRIRTIQCYAEQLNVPKPVDFVGAFYSMHAVDNRQQAATRMAASLAPGGRLLLVEPKLHVSRKTFTRLVDAFRAVGLAESASPRVRFSHARLMAKPNAD
jgi:ubiquinone/menaquinone biosynthesis C-methylase UbiE